MEKYKDKPYCSPERKWGVKKLVRELSGGLSINDILYLDDNIDLSIRKSIYQEIEKNKEMDRISLTLDVAEAFRMAYASIKVGKGKGFAAYKRWYNFKIRRYNKLAEVKMQTIWDNMKRSRRL